MTAVRELLAIPRILRAPHEPPEQVAARQLRSMRAMLHHARHTVPHYGSVRYDVPLRRLDDVARLPVLYKAEILERGEAQFRSSQIRDGDVVMTRTSGTSGQRVNVAHDHDHFAYHNATCLRRFLATDRYRPWHRLVHLRPMEMPGRWYQRLGLFRREIALSSWPPDRIREKLRQVRPHVLIGYPTMLRELIRMLPPDELDQLRSSLVLLFTESELLLPAHRAQLEETFGVPVFDEYSSYETLNITFECASGSAHVAEDRVLVEVVDAFGDPVAEGREGAVVVTAFQERAMPLVRYALGDRARFVPGPCACGRTFRRLELTTGRADDHVVLPDGSLLYVATFLYLAAYLPGVAESSVRQDATGALTIYLLPDGSGGDLASTARAYVERLYELTGRRFPVTVERLDRVSFTEGGKGRFLVSSYQR
jgi:phenylacetate-CoA ligase